MRLAVALVLTAGADAGGDGAGALESADLPARLAVELVITAAKSSLYVDGEVDGRDDSVIRAESPNCSAMRRRR